MKAEPRENRIAYDLCVLIIGVALITLACTTITRAPEADPRTGRLTVEGEKRDFAPGEMPAEVPKGPFGLSMVASSDGQPVDIEDFVVDEECGFCHERQWEELEGSMHSVAHRDSLYRATAEMALREAGPEVYALCAGCHAAQGVAAGLIPATPEEELPEVAKAGVLCDTCHSVTALSGESGVWGEPGNASIVLEPDIDRKFGPPSGDDDVAIHTVETREFLSGSEFCGSCHTVIHPFNGVRLEHTYAEWKSSAYAEAGIQCQDCHMRSVPEAIRVAAEMKPVPIEGLSEPSGELRPIARHYFVGGNHHADRLGGGEQHAEMAAERLRSAAVVELGLPDEVAGDSFEIEVSVRNIGAGHSLPTSLVELRRVWVDLVVTDAGGNEIFRSGWDNEGSDVPEDVMRFGALAGDAEGNPTYKPWEVARFLWKRVIPPKGVATDTFRIPVSEASGDALNIEARLHYTLVPDFVARAIMGEGYVELEAVEMAAATGTVAIRR